MSKPVILTGLRANNDLHIGNYFGAMLPMVEMAQQKAGEYQINMFIPDLHSFTTPIDHNLLQDQILNNARLYAAAGLPLDHDDILLYRQSYVPAHSELTWILDCFTSYGIMTRMTQFKDKARYVSPAEKISETIAAFNKMAEKVDPIADEAANGNLDPQTLIAAILEYSNFTQDALKTNHEILLSEQRGNSVSVGLFNYPVLMAADMLLYGAKYIPVGEDQTQHLEYTRDIAERMNKQFGDLLVVPDPVDKQHEFFNKGQALRIKDLMDPTKKMSKSDDTGKGVIFLTDDPASAAKKIMSATTDDLASVNYNPLEQPGISNLLQILALLRGVSINDIEAEFKGQSSYGEFKRVVADEVAAFLTNFQSKLAEVNDEVIHASFERSERVANEQANATLYRVQQAVGLRPRS